MARQSQPWWNEREQAWYSKVKGKQVPLGRGTKTEAWKALREVLAHGPPAPPAAGPTCREVLNRFLADCDARVRRDEMKPVTLEGYLKYLAAAGAAFGDVEAPKLRPHHVMAWVDGRPTWGPTSRYNAITAIKAATAGAKRLGHLEADPLAGMARPTPRRREAILTDEQVGAILAAVRDRAFRDFLTALRETGARPGEVMTITAAETNADRGVWVLPPRRQKTGGKTGLPRVVFLTPRMVEVTRERAAEHPEGPIFRNARGGPWTRFALKNRFWRLRAKLGYGGEATAYSYRHGYATDALEAGVPIATVAELLGHADTTMVSRIYSKLNERHAHLREAANRVRPADPGDEVSPGAP
jgi:integrase